MIATSKITNGTMMSQFRLAAVRPRTRIILILDLSLYDPSMKLDFLTPAFEEWFEDAEARVD